MRRLNLLSLIVIAVAGVAACSRTSSPAEPTGVSGATINGSIVAPGASGGTNGSTSGSSAMSTFSTASTAPAGLTVSVAGTNISASVDAAGQFVLKNVPPGNADLRFNAPGLAAALGLSDLQPGQVVSLTVSISGSKVALESDRRSHGREEQLEGLIESLPPTTAAQSFVAAGRTVTTDTNTRFSLRGSPATFADLDLGQRVHVKGQTSGSSLLASRVEIQNTNASPGTGLNVTGVISDFIGTAAAFEFIIDGRLIKGDALTVFFGNTQFKDIANNKIGEVIGEQRGYIYALRLHIQSSDDDDDDGEENEIEFRGVITSKTGTIPRLTLVVGGKTVKTVDATEVSGKGDDQTLAALREGMTVEVSGWLQPDATVTAKKIHIEGDTGGGEFEIKGHMGRPSGTCPAISFSVNDYTIVTTEKTTFVTNCSGLSSGAEVRVKGIVQDGRTVKATKVEKK